MEIPNPTNGTRFTHDLEILPFRESHLAVHRWLPEPAARQEGNTPGTVLILHGYLSHTGHLAYPIEKLIQSGYAVVAADLPGHGISGGNRGGISEFSEYAESLKALEKHARQGEVELPEPFHAVGFSTGASAIIEYLRLQSTGAGDRFPDRFERIVLVSPLIRHHGYRSSWLGYYLFRWAVPSVRAINADESDPLTVDRVPSSWLGAAIRWNRNLRRMPPHNRELLILQGTADEVVQHRYNIPFLRKRFPRARVLLLEDARHEILRHRGVREITTALLIDYLSQ